MRRLLALLALASGAALPVTAQTPEAPPPEAVPAGLTGTWSGAVIEDGMPWLFTLEMEVAGDSLATTLVLPYNGYDAFPYAFAYTPPDSERASASGGGVLTSGLAGDMRLLVDLAEQNLRGTVSREDSVVGTVYLQKVVPYGLPPIARREFQVASGADTLAGSLVLPAGPAYARGPHPAVVLVGGRGYGGRWDMAWLARLYARNGIAALVWDGRGQGRSTGDAATVTSAERVADVRAVLDWALALPEIDPAQVGVHGYSAGGWIAPLAAEGRGDVAFMITAAGPAEPLAEQQGHTTTELMRRSDSTYTPEEYDAAFAYQRDLVHMAQRGATWPEYQAVNAAARGSRWAEHALIPESLSLPDLDYYARMPGLDPRPALARWERPLLAVFGSRDWIVPPQHNAPLVRQLTADNPDATAVVLDMGHALERPAGLVGEGEWPERYRRDWTRVPEFFDTLLTWLDARTVTVAEREASGG